MSDEEEEKEEEENEDEEGEGEENEDEEGEGEEDEDEEGEDDEGEENEDEEGEGEEDEDEEDNKKKKKKNKDKDKDNKNKFPDSKLILTNEINFDLSKNNMDLSKNYNSNFSFPLINIPPKPKTVLDILNEINYEMETLSNDLNKTLSFIDHKSIDREKYELQDLLNKAKELTKVIDISESKKEDKFIQSELDDVYNKGIQTRDDINQDISYNQNYQNNYQSNLTDFNQNQLQRNNFPYDPNKNKDYYSSLGNNFNNNNNTFTNNNNNFNNNNNNFNNRFNTSRVKNMDDLYRNNPFIGKQPIIYSQTQNSNIPLSQPQRINPNYNNSNNPNLNYNINQQRPFERYKPQSISHAMDILLDKQNTMA